MTRMELPEIMSVLARTPKVLDALLDGLPPEWLHRDDGAGTWSAYDIVGHLLHADATNWVPRARMIVEHGTDRMFEPFDREAMLGWDREPAAALLARFQDRRQAALGELSSLGLAADDLDRRGRHPHVGEVTLGQMLAAWVAHDLTHLGQVGEVLARRFRDDVGPWRPFLPALDRVAAAE
jgi:uncharacterized damage-inducible protein DinB